jgi:DNA topoisomerase-1
MRSKKQNNKEGPSKERMADKKPPRKRVKRPRDSSGSSEEDTKPLVAKKGSRKSRKIKEESVGNDSSDDDKPIAKKAAKARATKVTKEEQPSAEAAKHRKRGKVGKGEELASPVKGKGKKEEEEEEVFRWWEQDPNGDGSMKWATLEHNGVIFPPPYEPLPSQVKMLYNGVLFWFSFLLHKFYIEYR